MNKILHSPHTPIIAILFLAFALRLWMLGTRSLWYDDAFSVLLAERGPAAIALGTAVDTMPPGYYLLLFVWMNVVGQSPLAMRMLSVALSMLVIALVYVIAKRGFGTPTAQWAAFLAALMPFQIYHAQELRMYTLLALGGLIYLYGVMQLADSKRFCQAVVWRRARDSIRIRVENPSGPVQWRALAFIALGTMLALYSHNLAFVSLLAGNIYFLIKREWRKQAHLLFGQCIGALFFTPWLFYVPTQLEKIQRAFWTQTPGLVDVLQMLLVFTTYLPLPPLLIALALFVSLLVLILVLWQLLKLARREHFSALGLHVTFVLVPPMVLFGMSYLIRPVFVPRGAIASALVYAILMAVVVARAPRRAQIGLAAFALLVASALLPFYYSAYGEWRRAPYVEANALLREQWRAGDVILHDNKLAFFPMHLYDRSLPQMFLADPPQSDNDTFALASQQAMELYPSEFEPAVNGKARVWFVIYQTAIEQAEGVHANLARLDEKFQRVQENEYGDVRIFLFKTR